MRLNTLDQYWLSQLAEPLEPADHARLIMLERHLTDSLEIRLVRQALALAPDRPQPEAVLPTAEEEARRAQLIAYGEKRLTAAKEEARRQQVRVDKSNTSLAGRPIARL